MDIVERMGSFVGNHCQLADCSVCELVAQAMFEIEALRSGALDYVREVQSSLLSSDANLLAFDLTKEEALLDLLRPEPRPHLVTGD